MADERELLPCPFCGSEDVRYEDSGGGGCLVCWGGNCGSGPWRTTKAEAVAAWNRRADPPQPEEVMQSEPVRDSAVRHPDVVTPGQGVGASASAPTSPTDEEWELAEIALDWIEEEEREASAPDGEGPGWTQAHEEVAFAIHRAGVPEKDVAAVARNIVARLRAAPDRETEKADADGDSSKRALLRGIDHD